MDTILKNLTQGIVRENQTFMLVGLVKEGASGAFNDAVNVDSENKAYILCACQLKDYPYDTIFYFSNDPVDFINNKTSVSKNFGVAPLRIKNNLLHVDLLSQDHNRTLPLPENPKINYYSNDKPVDYYFTSKTNNILFPINRLQHGIPYEINLKNNARKNFYIRKNVSTGRIGPSVSIFSQPSTAFEYLKTNFYASYGTSLTFNSSLYNTLGVSRLTLETNSENYSSLPISYKTAIVKLKQGTSLWYNVIDNLSGVSDFQMEINNGNSFLNTTVYNPDTSIGISVEVNIRNDESNFVSIPNLNITSTQEVFDYYLVNLNGFTSGGNENNSSQYHDSNSNIVGGICYFMDTIHTYYNYFRQNNMKGFLNNLNVLNQSEIVNYSTNNSLKTSRHAEGYTVFSDYYDAIYAINQNDFNSFDPNDNCGKVRAIANFKNNICALHNKSLNNLNNPNGNVFSDNPKTNQTTYLIEIIVSAVIVFVYIIFAFYYYIMKLN